MRAKVVLSETAGAERKRALEGAAGGVEVVCAAGAGEDEEDDEGDAVAVNGVSPGHEATAPERERRCGLTGLAEASLRALTPNWLSSTGSCGVATFAAESDATRCEMGAGVGGSAPGRGTWSFSSEMEEASVSETIVERLLRR